MPLGARVQSRYDSRMSVENRIVDLEIRLAYQDKLIAQLDEVVREFANRVDALERRVSEHEMSADPDIGPGDDRPPHY